MTNKKFTNKQFEHIEKIAIFAENNKNRGGLNETKTQLILHVTYQSKFYTSFL